MNLRTKIVQRLIHCNEAIFFYPKLRKFYEKNLRGENVNILDVGANKGQSIDFFLKINPNLKIDVFEPNKKLFLRLKEKYQPNERIGIHNLGVSNVKGSLTFHENILDETSTFEEFNPDSEYLKRKAKILGVTKENLIVDSYDVEVIKLSDFLKSRDTAYDVLKIDAEGHELQCLQGLFDTDKPCSIRLIQFESHNDDMYLNSARHEDIDGLLQRNGFRKIADIKHGFGDFSELIYENTNRK